MERLDNCPCCYTAWRNLKNQAESEKERKEPDNDSSRSERTPFAFQNTK